MKEVMLNASPRELTTKHQMKELRSSGNVPGVFYGHGEKNIHLTVDAKKLDETVLAAGGATVLVKLNVGGVEKLTIIKDVKRDIISRKPIHVDFLAVSLKEKIEVHVPLHILGIAPGVKLGGGIMEHILREVRIKCLPTEIPKSIDVDVSKLEINHSIVLKDLPPIQGVDILTDPASIIVNIVAPTELEEAPAPGAEAVAAAGATAAAEPEVISKGKKDKEGEEAAAAPADKKGAKAPEKK